MDAMPIEEVVGGHEFYGDGWVPIANAETGIITTIVYVMRSGTGHEILRVHVPMHVYIRKYFEARPVIESLIQGLH